jgi:hypothetical protein
MSFASDSPMKRHPPLVAMIVMTACASAAATTPAAALSKAAPAGPPTTVNFAGEAYTFTKGKPRLGEYEYAATAQPGPADRHDTLVIDVLKEFGTRYSTGDMAYRMIASIHDLGILVNTHPLPVEAGRQPEYLIVTNAPASGSREIAYSRILTMNGILATVTWTHRVFGNQATADAADWLRVNHSRIEQTVADWDDWHDIASAALAGTPPQAK